MFPLRHPSLLATTVFSLPLLASFQANTLNAKSDAAGPADWEAISRMLTSNRHWLAAVGASGSGIPVQEAYLKASNTGPADSFGISIAASGDTVVVGAPGEDGASPSTFLDSGAAYVFVRSGESWVQQAYLTASNAEPGDQFGWSVAISGDTIVVGARHEFSSATGVNGNEEDNSASYAGAAYVFVRSGLAWSQQAYLKASNTGGGDKFGWAVNLSGDTVVVSAPFEESNATGVNGNQADNSAFQAGAAYVFVRNGTTWIQQAYLKASNTDPNDVFGWSASLSGDTILIGACREGSASAGVNGNQADNSAFGAGAGYVFRRLGSTWTQEAYIKASNPGFFDQFGVSASLSGDTAVLGASLEDSGATGVNGNQLENGTASAGAAYVFGRTGSTWSQEAYLKASSTGEGDVFGRAVATSGDAVLVGAELEDSNAVGINGNASDDSAPNAGAAYLFVREGSGWRSEAYLKASNTDPGDEFGYAVALSGNLVLVGAPGEGSIATGVNGDEQNNSAPAAGAVYLFDRSVEGCFLVLAESPGSVPLATPSHTWTTQLAGIVAFLPCTRTELPAFPLPVTPITAQAPGGRTGPSAFLAPREGEPTALARFAAQLLVWDPTSFPERPEQWSNGLEVVVWSDGTATAQPYGSPNHVTLTLELFRDARGRPFLRFPFTMR